MGKDLTLRILSRGIEMDKYEDRRRKQGQIIEVLLLKHREALLREDNKLRQELKESLLRILIGE